LVQDTNGDLYGTTADGGANHDLGTVFSLSVGLSPFVKPQPTAARSGATVQIPGADLTDATSVTLNGTVAAVTTASSSLIVATVPGSVTSGTVHVVTPGGTLASNVPFRVLP
jgi:uncharacterized repeat protein (TIGR03803 family)